MKIHFCGAAREVTGTRHLIEVNGKNILLDCGMVQGHRKDARQKNSEFLFDPKKIDVVVLSHAHIDHSGILPVLWKQGFRGKIYCNSATADILSYMLYDSAHIQEMDAKFLKKKRGEIIEPLYTKEDADHTLELVEIAPYHERVKLTPEVSFEFYDAGHILGSCSVHLEITENGKTTKLGFTGDLGRKGLPIIRDPEYMKDLDYLICESTYGNREHHPFKDVCKKLGQNIREVIERGGKVIIPSFALERAQEIVYILHRLHDDGLIPTVPIYVDSPLTSTLFEVFRRHGECYDEEMKAQFVNKDHPPFRFSNLKQTADVEESKNLNQIKEPMIIISASGMCETGRILHHLLNNIEDEKNMVLFVGYQAQGTLGRKIIEGAKEIKIFGEYYKVNAEIESYKEFSAHADYHDILDYINHTPHLKKLYLVHGEDDALSSLHDKVKAAHPTIEVIIPSLDDELEV